MCQQASYFASQSQAGDISMVNASETGQRKMVLVTGISGFLAGHIALQLLQQGYRVRGSLRTLDKGAAVTQNLKQAGGTGLENLSFVEADLLKDEGWEAAVVGCDYVIHTASPFPPGLPQHEDDLIRPAREGSLRVLKAAHAVRIRRVVLTSSIAATNYGRGQAPFSEEDWTDVNGPQATPYYKSKTLAEQAAWAYAREVGLDLAVINPGLILGPLLSAGMGTSVSVIQKLLSGEFPALPRFGMCVVDVRDVADAHLRAMIEPSAVGQRFIVAGRFMWLSEIAAVLRQSFPKYAAKVPQRVVPNWLVRILALFDPTTRLVVGELGFEKSVNTNKAHKLLGWKSRPEEEAICASAQSLIDFGVIKSA